MSANKQPPICSWPRCLPERPPLADCLEPIARPTVAHWAKRNRIGFLLAAAVGAERKEHVLFEVIGGAAGGAEI
jgi:hypothetical protein